MYLGERGRRHPGRARRRSSPDWRTTVRVVHGPSGALVGAALAEWDEELGRAWIQGPWVDRRRRGSGRAGPGRCSTPSPPRCRRRSSTGRSPATVANERLAALAAELGWPPTRDQLRLRARCRDGGGVDGRSRPTTGCGRSTTTTCRRSSRCTTPSSRRRTSRPAQLRRAGGGRRAGRARRRATTTARSPATSPAGCSPTARATSTSSPSTRPPGAPASAAASSSGSPGGCCRRRRPAGCSLTVQEHRAPARALYESLGLPRRRSRSGATAPVAPS